jgi:hypothetical protein
MDMFAVRITASEEEFDAEAVRKTSKPKKGTTMTKQAKKVTSKTAKKKAKAQGIALGAHLSMYFLMSEADNTCNDDESGAWYTGTVTKINVNDYTWVFNTPNGNEFVFNRIELRRAMDNYAKLQKLSIDGTENSNINPALFGSQPFTWDSTIDNRHTRFSIDQRRRGIGRVRRVCNCT